MAETLTAKQNRFDYIDLAKAVGMLTIMWGHIAIGKSVTFVYAFHIPLFFFLSGMVFIKDKYRDFGSFVTRRVKTLIIPYIIYSFVTWAIWAAFSYATHAHVESYWMPLLQTFIAQGSEGYLVHNVPLWFVTCLFVIELAYYWIAKLPDVWNVVICVVTASIGYVLVNYCTFFDFTTLPWSTEVAMMALIFYSTGNLFVKLIGHEKFKTMVLKRQWMSTIFVVILFSIVYKLGQLNGRVSMGHAHINNPFLFYPIGYLGTFAMLGLTMLLSAWVKETKTGNAMKWFGQNSFIAMAIHNPIKGFAVVALAAVLGMEKLAVMRNTWTAILALLATLIATVVIMYLIVSFKQKVATNKGKHNKR